MKDKSRLKETAKRILSEHDITQRNVRYAGILDSMIEMGTEIKHVKCQALDMNTRRCSRTDVKKVAYHGIPSIHGESVTQDGLEFIFVNFIEVRKLTSEKKGTLL